MLLARSQVQRFWTEADINQPTNSAETVENDAHRKSAVRRRFLRLPTALDLDQRFLG